MKDEDERIIKRLLVVAGEPGEEHERLKKELYSWAVNKGYLRKYSKLWSGNRPDVLMGTRDMGHLFLGDAKDSESETSNNLATVSRIESYIVEFADLLGGSNFKGGIIAISTNSAESAEEWVICLNKLARTAGITDTENGKPNFKVKEINPKKTWIIYWQF